MHRRQPRHALDLALGGVRPRQRDIVSHRGGEQEGLLRHPADRRAQRVHLVFLQRHAVPADAAGRQRVLAQQQAQQRGLAAAGGADDAQGLAASQAQLDRAQRRRDLPRISEVQAVPAGSPLGSLASAPLSSTEAGALSTGSSRFQPARPRSSNDSTQPAANIGQIN